MNMTEYVRKPWAQHMRELRWKQGEHILICGPNGAGKTTMAATLLNKRADNDGHVVVLVSKMKDPTFAAEFKGYKRMEEWPTGGPKRWENKILLWPKPEKEIRGTLAKQKEVFAKALNDITRHGNRAVVIDESLMMTDPKLIGLGTEIGMMHYYGRSSGISMVDLTQRPSWIPRVIYSSVSHAYVATTKDTTDLKRLAELGGIDARTAAMNIARLPVKQDYLYLNPTGDALPHIVNTRK